MSAVRSGMATAAARLSVRFLLVALLVTLAFVATATLFERDASPSHALDHSLLGAVFGLSVPLSCYALVSRVAGETRLDHAVVALSRHGANRRQLVFGMLVLTTSTAAAATVLMAVTAVIVAGEFLSQPWRELGTLAWIGAFAAVSYVSLFSLGSLFGRRGGGRFLMLAADWLLGSSSTFVALGLPRGHVRNLLGGEPVMGFGQASASTILAGLALLYVGVTLWRVRR